MVSEEFVGHIIPQGGNFNRNITTKILDVSEELKVCEIPCNQSLKIVKVSFASRMNFTFFRISAHTNHHRDGVRIRGKMMEIVINKL